MFLLGSIFTWLFLFEIIVILASGWWESSFFSTVALIAMGITGYYMGGKELHFLAWWVYVLGVLGYFVIGIGWSFVKWTHLMAKKREELAEKKKNFYDGYSNTDPAKIEADWKSHIKAYHLIPEPKEFISELVYWIAYWPLSLLWAILKDLLTDIGRWIYRKLSGLYQKITDHYFKNI